MNPKKLRVFLFIVLVVLSISLSSPGNMFSLSLPGVDFPDIWSGSLVDFPRAQYDLGDSAKLREGVQSRPTKDPQEMTREIYETLDNLVFPKPSGHFTMDGELDSCAVLLAANGGVPLHAAVRGSQLYVATASARSQKADMCVFVSVAPSELRSAPFKKSGRVAAWSAVLMNRVDDSVATWSDASEDALTNIVDGKVGRVLEGVVDFELLTGITAGTVYLAVGKYEPKEGGALLRQVPRGSNDGQIDANEFYEMGTGLPFRLASFSVVVASRNRVRVSWKISGASNSSEFKIQKRRAEEAEFRTVRNSSTPAHGPTNEPQAYSFVEANVLPGTWQYRLRQVDGDGNVSYGPEEVVIVGKVVR